MDSVHSFLGIETMWRAFFLAVGVTLLLVGLETLVLDKAVLAADSVFKPTEPAKAEPVYDAYGLEVDQRLIPPPPRTVSPPEWAPWSLLSTGAIVLLYAMSMQPGDE